MTDSFRSCREQTLALQPAINITESCGSAVGTATGLGLNDR
jgi:hypothetical protein